MLNDVLRGLSNGIFCLQTQQLQGFLIGKQDGLVLIHPNTGVVQTIDNRLGAFFFKHQLGQIAVLVFVQFARHLIDGSGQFAKFIGGVDVHSVSVIFTAKLLNGFVETANWPSNQAWEIEDKSETNQEQKTGQGRNVQFSLLSGTDGNVVFTPDGLQVDL